MDDLDSMREWLKLSPTAFPPPNQAAETQAPPDTSWRQVKGAAQMLHMRRANRGA
jgi:hypothetical protein